MLTVQAHSSCSSSYVLQEYSGVDISILLPTVLVETLSQRKFGNLSSVKKKITIWGGGAETWTWVSMSAKDTDFFL